VSSAIDTQGSTAPGCPYRIGRGCCAVPNAALSERLRAVLRRRAETRREALTRLHETFADELGPLPDEPPVELGDLSPEELARLTVDVLWPPSAEERRMRAQRLLDQVFAEVSAKQAAGVASAHN
jgi:hypothetical protein